MRPQPPGSAASTTTLSTAVSASTVSLTSTSGSSDNPNDLRNAEWYWGNMSRKEVNSKLAGLPDGSFLVRDSHSQEGEYTLTLIKDGTEKLIKICEKDGKYGFTECTFNSVVELINYYKVNSLQKYAKTLDITLSNPVPREKEMENYDIMLLAIQFEVDLEQLKQAQHEHDNKLDEFKAVNAVLNDKINNLNVYDRANKIFLNQFNILNMFITNQPQAGNDQQRLDDIEKLKLNAEMLNDRHIALKKEMDKLEHYVQELRDKYMLLDREINAAKPQLQNMVRRKELAIERLMRAGLTEDDIRLLTDDGFAAWKERYDRVSNQPHKDETMWFLGNCTRQRAEELLAGAPTGTFLVRPRSVGHYALSITCNGTVNHCLIYETDTGFGFAAPYNIYHTVMSLVEHYATNSLEEHNDTLTTTLRYPVLYWHKNRDMLLEQLEKEQDLIREQQLLQQNGEDESEQQQQQQLQQQLASSYGSNEMLSGFGSRLDGDGRADDSPPSA